MVREANIIKKRKMKTIPRYKQTRNLNVDELKNLLSSVGFYDATSIPDLDYDQYAVQNEKTIIAQKDGIDTSVCCQELINLFVNIWYKNSIKLIEEIEKKGLRNENNVVRNIRIFMQQF